jgi:hypothetical protein
VIGFGWRVATPDRGVRRALVAALPAAACRALLLCPAVGCPCATGAGAEPACRVEVSGDRWLTAHCEGPDWLVRALEHEASVTVQVELGRALSGREVEAMHRELVALAPGAAIFSASV